MQTKKAPKVAELVGEQTGRGDGNVRSGHIVLLGMPQPDAPETFAANTGCGLSSEPYQAPQGTLCLNSEGIHPGSPDNGTTFVR